MNYATFSLPHDTTPRLGVVHAGSVVDVKKLIEGTWPGVLPGSLLDLIRLGPDAWREVAELVERGLSTALLGECSHQPAEVRWHAPIPRPGKNIFCLGLNYTSHMEETARAQGRQATRPEAPVFFSKAPTTVIGPYDPIPWDRSTTQEMDYEVELAVIIGVDGKNISRASALGHVFGYTVINDVTARDLQRKHVQWFKGKSLDGSCPMGPVVVTADAFGDPQRKRISLRVNGVVKQDASTAEMLFPVDVIIESLSHGMTLEAGDLIATGTPAGVGFVRTPPEFLRDGDFVETEVEGIGTLRNRVVAGSAGAPS